MDVLGQVRAFLSGRGRRREFWLCLAGLIAANIAAAYVGGASLAPIVSLALLPVWLIVAGRRLHDFGQTWLWGLIPFGLGFVVGFTGAFARRAGAQLPVDAATLSLAVNLISLAVMLVIGLWPGTRGANRFGPGHAAGAADEFG